MTGPGPRSDGGAADLWGVVLSVGLAAAVAFTPLGEWRPAAILVGLPFVLLVPGYALVSAVFPRAGEAAPSSFSETSWLARLGLSVGGSVVAIAVVGVVLDFTVWGFRRTAVLSGLSLVTLAATAFAFYRRRRTPADARVSLRFSTIRSRTRDAVTGGGVVGIALSVLVVVAAAGAVGVVARDSTPSSNVTAFYVLGENAAGDLRADSQPKRLTAGEPATVGIGVDVRGPESFEGRVVGSLERVSVDGDSVRVRRSRELVRFPVRVEAGGSVVDRHVIRPSMTGERLRLTYRLYRTDDRSPVRQVHVWTTVTAA
ncbi:DUF1616 domain-containing protein [Halomicroarcula limicola]|uniref:DUF1616 domain-containing protein n=1 Tax=Haloarcula limicola TaxID=1429915 RepID=A0A8J7YB29_9EURY|nr:DUF1616 domain-containing protein [Halomicroarcula limicola]MBV0923976.1 DUF1616 domain-containing protein [Halomicroarcula limicola]